jgi:prophage DNA circulation protein
MEFPDDIYGAMATVMASCYRSIDWSKAGQKSAYDYFAARVRSAGHERTVPAAMDRLAKRCRVMSFLQDMDAMALMQANSTEVLRRMRNESIYVALLAAKLAKEQKALAGNVSLERF